MATLKRTTSAIQNFIASMNKSGGYARTSKYAVVITPPTSLAQLASERIEPVVEGGRFEQGFPSSPANPNASTMQSLYKQLGQQVNLHCNTVSMPGHDLQAQDMQHGSAPGRQIVTSHDYAGTINASFYLDSHMRERHFFEMWQKMAVGMTNHKAGYYDDYIGTIQILQLGSLDGEGDRDVPTYGIEATEVYPESVTAIEYNYGSVNQIVRVTVAFQYKQWHNLTTDSIAGMSFGASDQTQHDIAQPDRGLIGKLPPELQRTARDVFTQAKNQVPIGRLFKGKLFPPFF